MPNFLFECFQWERIRDRISINALYMVLRMRLRTSYLWVLSLPLSTYFYLNILFINLFGIEAERIWEWRGKQKDLETPASLLQLSWSLPPNGGVSGLKPGSLHMVVYAFNQVNHHLPSLALALANKQRSLFSGIRFILYEFFKNCTIIFLS